MTVGVGRDHWKQLCSDIADITERPRWHQWAACRGRPVAWFYPPTNTRSDRHRLDDALRCCRECPVKTERLEAAIRRKERHGVWGGRLFYPDTRRRVEASGRQRAGGRAGR